MIRRRMALPLALLLLAGAAGPAQTDQRPGPTGEFGKAIQVGKAAPVYFTLRSVEYRADRVMVDHYVWAAAEDSKLVVIHYSLQNPTKRSIGCNGTSPRFELYDTENNSYLPVGLPIGVGLEDTGKRVDMQLLPAHTVQVYLGFRVPAEVVCKKLIVMPMSQTEPVVRFDLTDKVDGLKAPWLDPKDETKAKPLAEAPGATGEWYPMGWYDFRLDSGLAAAEGLDAKAPKGSHWLCVTATVRNVSGGDRTASLTQFASTLGLADGGEAPLTAVYEAGAWRRLSAELSPKRAVTLRLVYTVPDGAEPKTLRMQAKGLDNNAKRRSRAFVYQLTPPAP